MTARDDWWALASLGGMSGAETAELGRSGTGRTGRDFGRLSPSQKPAHCLRFAHPAEADWKLEVRKSAGQYLGSI